MQSSNFTKFYFGFIIYNIVLTPIVWYFQNKYSFDNDTFLPSSIEATSAIVAIVFAISILVIQHAASNFSPTILKNFKKDKKVWFTLSYGIFTIFVLSLSLVFQLNIVLLDLFFFLNTIGLLAIFFLYTFEKINPISIVNDIRNQIMSECKKIPNKIETIKRQNIKKDRSGKYKLLSNAQPQITYHAILSNTPNLLTTLNTSELTLRQIVLASLKKDDFDTSRSGLDSYPIMFKNYLRIIPDFQWIEDKFLTEMLEDMKSYSNYGFEDKNSIFVDDLITAFGKSGEIFEKEISPLGGHFDNNHPLSLCIYYLRDISLIAYGKGMYDVSTNAIKEIGKLGQIVFPKYHHDHLAIYYMMPIANLAIQKGDFYVPHNVAIQSFKIIQTMIAHLTDHITIEQQIKDFTKMLENFAKSKINKMSLMGLFSEIAQSGPIPCIAQCLFIKNTEFEEIETLYREKLEKDIVNLIIELVGKVGISAQRSGDTVSATSCANCLTLIAGLIHQEEFITVKNRHQEELQKICSYLLSLHHYEKELFTSYDTDIVERIVETLLYCLKGNYLELVKEEIEYIANLVNRVLDEDERGFTAIRTIRKLDILGCYGIAKNIEEISVKVADKYLDFEENFEAKFGKSPMDPAHDHDRYSLDDYDQFGSKYKPFEELTEIMTPENGAKFEILISDMRDIRKRVRESSNES